MTAFEDLRAIAPREVWEGILARSVNGERLTMAVVELAPGAHAREHQHDHEQLGIVLEGVITVRIGDERQELSKGATYVIPSNVPHEAIAGPDGCVVIDIFAPVRGEWKAIEPLEPAEPRWP